MPQESEEPTIAVPVANASASEPVIASAIYALEVGDAAQRVRLAELAAQVEQLRADSTSGWQAFQSDITGYAGEVSGGRLPIEGTPQEAVAQFLDRYGALFGVPRGLVFGLGGYDDEGYATVWAEQVVGDVPVDGARLTAAVRVRGAVSEVQEVSGTLIDTTGVPEQPAISAAEAVASVSGALGVVANPEPLLVVTTHQGAARLTWAVTVESGPTMEGNSFLGSSVQYPALVFVDATDGSILAHRVSATSPTGLTRGLTVPSQDVSGSSAIDYGNYGFDLPSGGRPIVIETNYLGRLPIKVNAQQLPDGSIVLIDSTGDGASTVTKKGLIVGLDGKGLSTQSTNGDLVSAATLVRYPSVESIPVDALYALWGARQTLDYLKNELGMLSFDGNNSPVPIVYNYTDGDSCLDNAYFATAPGLSHMGVGVPCTDTTGKSLPTVADIDTIAHEIGHGVVHSHTFARSTIQQGAMDEGLGDYLGLIMRVGTLGEARPVSSVDICRSSAVANGWCNQWKDGVGLRSMNTGATFDQYAFTIEDALWNTVADVYADSGHTNSMVWTNALWQARNAVASVDGGDMVSSERARVFDRSVIRAATRWTPGTDFGTASEVILRSATEAGMTAQELNLIRDRFRANGICRGCQTRVNPGDTITPVSISTDIKSRPVALGAQVGFLLATPDSNAGGVVATPGSPRQQRVGPPAEVTTHISGHGTTVLQSQAVWDADGANERYQLGQADAVTGRFAVVTEDIDVAVAPAASATAHVWVSQRNEITFQPVGGGSPKTFPAGGEVAHVATSGDKVAFLMADGRLRVWIPASGAVRELAVYNPSPVRSFRPRDFLLPLGSLDMSGDRVAVVGSTIRPGPVQVFDLAANTKSTMSEAAVPLGVAINDRYVVWVQERGRQQSPIFSEGEGWRAPDTELQGYAFGVQQKYRIVDFRGQQAYPSLSDDDLLAWQESGNGHSDIYATRLGTS